MSTLSLDDVIPVCVLAGGLGTRLRPLTDSLPKPMVPVAGRPFLHLLLESLAKEGLRHFVLAVSYQWQSIADYFADGRKFGWRVEYSVESQPLGTGGALLLARKFWHNRTLVLNGDTFMPLDWRAMIQMHIQSHRRATMALAYQPSCDRYGQVKYRNGVVSKFLEKRPHAGAGWINGGCYVLEGSALDGRPAGTTFSLEQDVFPQMAGEIGVYPSTGPFTDIGTFETLESFQQAALRARGLRQEARA